MSDNRISLSGEWKRLIDGVAIDRVTVPGSYPPVGECVLEREFPCDRKLGKGERVFLVTEGVLASAEFSVNGVTLGKAGPWCTYRFELPPGLLAGRNTVQARVCDIVESFGPMPGRRFDGGLARPIRVERRAATFLADMHFTYQLSDDFSSADCCVAVELDGPDRPEVHVALAEAASGRVIAQAVAAAGHPARFTVARPRLWSPNSPALYTLRATLGGDNLTERVGFRRITTDQHDFFLNGERLLLKGVCRHEFTHASGYSPSITEVKAELAAIKAAGFSYIRLVHSPHAACVCRTAAQLGLLVSEEPGTCFHDLSDAAIAAPALECLRRTVKRDRNVPSIFAWLIYNECNPNAEYARHAAAVCRELDPGCRLSMADCSGKDDDIKAMVQAADLSYYGINMYTYWPNDYCKRFAVLNDRPFVITEWGGSVCQGNLRVLRHHCDSHVQHTRERETLRMAGCSFWVWADYEEHSRPGPAAIDGWTIEGLVTAQGKAKPDLGLLSRMCADMDRPAKTSRPRLEVLLPRGKRRVGQWQQVPLDKLAGDQSALERVVDDMRRGYRHYDQWFTMLDPQLPAVPRFGRLLVDGIEFVCRDTEGPAHPLLLGAGREEVVIPVNARVSAVAVLGHVALKGGYPSSAVFSVHHRDAEKAVHLGDVAAKYVFEHDDGQTTLPLRHGLEVLRSNDICRWWTPAPRAPYTRPALRSVVHPSYEVLRVDLWEHAFAGPVRLKAIHWRLKDPEAILLTCGVSVKTAA